MSLGNGLLVGGDLCTFVLVWLLAWRNGVVDLLRGRQDDGIDGARQRGEPQKGDS